MYVAIANSSGPAAVVSHDDPDAATTNAWMEWVIPLQAFADQGINLTNVDKFAIGLCTKANMAAPSGSGTMYFDDIRLYRPRLVGHWKFDGDLMDASGNDRDGTAAIDPVFVAGKVSQAISLGGIGDFVEVTSYKGVREQALEHAPLGSRPARQRPELWSGASCPTVTSGRYAPTTAASCVLR